MNDDKNHQKGRDELDDLDRVQSFYEKSAEVSKQCIKHHREYGVVSGPPEEQYGTALLLLGDLCKEQGNLTEARAYYEKALEFFEQEMEYMQDYLYHQFGYGESNFKLGKLCEEQGDWDSAQRFCKEAIDTFEKLKEVDSEYEFHKNRDKDIREFYNASDLVLKAISLEQEKVNLVQEIARPEQIKALRTRSEDPHFKEEVFSQDKIEDWSSSISVSANEHETIPQDGKTKNITIYGMRRKDQE